VHAGGWGQSFSVVIVISDADFFVAAPLIGLISVSV
jgi:hypothetical protein